MGNHEIAMHAFERALSYNDVSVEALQLIANVLRAEDKYPDAAGYLETIIRLDSGNGEAWSGLGMDWQPVERTCLTDLGQAIATS